MNLNNLVNGCFKKGKHDLIIKKLLKRIKNNPSFSTIRNNAEYFLPNSQDVFGEVDILVEGYNNRLFIFEIKSNTSYTCTKKAKYQLDRMEKYVNDWFDKKYNNIYKFYVSGYKKDDIVSKYKIRKV